MVIRRLNHSCRNGSIGSKFDAFYARQAPELQPSNSRKAVRNEPEAMYHLVGSAHHPYLNSRLASDERMGATILTVVRLFPKSATASNSANGTANGEGSFSSGASPNTPSP